MGQYITNSANVSQVSSELLETSLDFAAAALPLFGLLYFCGTYYYRFCTGGTSGKTKLNLSDVQAAHENVKVFLDIQIGSSEPARVELVLFAQHYPRTCENFRALCTGE